MSSTARLSILAVVAATILLLTWGLWMFLAPEDGPDFHPGRVDEVEADENGVEARRSPTTAVPAKSHVIRGRDDVDTIEIITPDYGAALKSVEACAVFELRDAKNQVLEGEVVDGVELWRKSGEEWVRHDGARFDSEASKVHCGTPEKGLPEGEYELDVSGGPYGVKRVPFTLRGGEFPIRTVTLPHWRRIIRLRFADSSGKTLARVTQAPRYRYTSPKLPPRGSGRVMPEQLLADVQLAAFRQSLTIPHIENRVGWEAYFSTDRGGMWLRVFAGLKATLFLDFDPARYDRIPEAIESDFSGSEWDDYPVLLSPKEGLAEKMKTWVHVNPDDPGKRSIRGARANRIGSPGNPKDMSDLLPGRMRVIVKVVAPMDISLRSTAGVPRKVERAFLSHDMQNCNSVWYLDVMRQNPDKVETVTVWFEDDSLFVSKKHTLSLPPRTPSELTSEHQIVVAASPVLLETTSLPPTLAAFTNRIDVSLPNVYEKPMVALIRPQKSGYGQIETALGEDALEALAEKGRVAVVYSGPSSGHYTVQRELDEETRAQLFGGTLVLGAPSRGFACRLVDSHLDGSPGVPAVLLRRQHVEIARKARAFLASGKPKSSAPADVFGHLARNGGNWYAAETRIGSDNHGYLFHSGFAFEVGEAYSLMLLSGPEDKPLLRIDFTAGEGFVDLGAVKLPD